MSPEEHMMHQIRTVRTATGRTPRPQTTQAPDHHRGLTAQQGTVFDPPQRLSPGRHSFLFFRVLFAHSPGHSDCGSFHHHMFVDQSACLLDSCNHSNHSGQFNNVCTPWSLNLDVASHLSLLPREWLARTADLPGWMESSAALPQPPPRYWVPPAPWSRVLRD